jgi:hypothetical protein
VRRYDADRSFPTTVNVISYLELVEQALDREASGPPLSGSCNATQIPLRFQLSLLIWTLLDFASLFTESMYGTEDKGN